MKNIQRTLIKIGLITAVVLFIYYDHVTSLSSKYEVVNDWDYLNRFIKIDEQLAVKPTVLDYAILPPYLVGIRLNLHQYNCKNGLRTKLSKYPIYFALNLNTAHYKEYTHRASFEDKLSKLGVKDIETQLDHRWIKTAWEKSERLHKFERECVRKRANNQTEKGI